jgi:hypothetical protein
MIETQADKSGPSESSRTSPCEAREFFPFSAERGQLTQADTAMFGSPKFEYLQLHWESFMLRAFGIGTWPCCGDWVK